MIPFSERLTEAVRRKGAPACVGLDPHIDRLPSPFAVSSASSRGDAANAAKEFCLGVIDAVADVVPSVKPQVAFFEALGAPGVEALEAVVAAAQDAGLLVVLDAKRGDIGSTARAYARASLDPEGPVGADAVTLSPYLGPESLTPFVEATDSFGAGAFVLVRTSNPGAVAWQKGPAEGGPADAVAAWIAEQNASRLGGSGFGPFGPVIGATLPNEAAHWRRVMPNAWFLVPGYGAQGASAVDCRPMCRNDGLGALIVSARGVLFPSSGQDGESWKDEIRARATHFAGDLQENL